MSALFLILPLLVEHCPPGPPAKASLIDTFEQRALATDAPLVDLPARHQFTPGLYSRTVTLKRGIIYTSRQHKTEHQFALLSGSVSVWHEDGSVRRLTAPHVGVTKPGTRRAILVHEDAVWTCFHPTSETDLDKLEELLVEARPEHLRQRHCQQPALAAIEAPRLAGAQPKGELWPGQE